MENKLKIFVVGGDKSYINWITYNNGNTEITNNIKDAGLVVFTGGEDVHPSFYNESIGTYTSSNLPRDIEEEKIYRSIPSHIPKLGICRGAQFLTVMNGYSLIQHVTNHALYGTHPIFLSEVDRFTDITSTHHQMCNIPFNTDYNVKIIAHAPQQLSDKYLNGENTNIEMYNGFIDPEIFIFRNTNCLCIQGHPELMDVKLPIIRYLYCLLMGELVYGPMFISKKSLDRTNALSNRTQFLIERHAIFNSPINKNKIPEEVRQVLPNFQLYERNENIVNEDQNNDDIDDLLNEIKVEAEDDPVMAEVEDRARRILGNIFEIDNE